MIPQWRTGTYGIWRACERFRIRPPEIRERWSDMNAWEQSMLIAYDQIRQYEEAEELSMMMKASAMRIM